MHHIGIDIIEIARIEAAIASLGDAFLKRIYTESELELCRRKPSSLAARFAGKEAVIKALGQQGEGISWKDIEILADASGKPVVHLHGKAQSQANNLKLDEFAISLSHSREYAAALVIGEPK